LEAYDDAGPEVSGQQVLDDPLMKQLQAMGHQ